MSDAAVSGFRLGEKAMLISHRTHVNGNIAEPEKFARKPRNRNPRQLAHWSELLPLLTLIRNHTEADTNDKLGKAIGYNSGTHFAEWQRNGVPVLAIYAAKGLLATLGIGPKPPVVRQFSQEVLVYFLTVISRLPKDDKDRAPIIARLAEEIAAA